MANAKNNGIWYIGVDTRGKLAGFTQEEEYALKTEDGSPVLAPGNVRRVWNAEYARIKARRDRIWEMLLDTMEEKIELDEKSAVMPNDAMLVDARIDAFQCALAVLELPPGKYDEDPTAAVQTIANKAAKKYEEES
ncbi:hypothetical protein SEA_DUMPTRUCK_49 [Gordonia phage DumpTruck]|nr:hypothetical protein SEA_DUMPTRUCK_49 [Gordonia phage DumpTruck]